MIIKETDILNPSWELATAKLGCRYALKSAYESSKVSETFFHFINAVSPQLPECVLFRREGPKGLREIRSYFLPKSFEIYKYTEEGSRTDPLNLLPEYSEFVGIPEIRKRGIPLRPFFNQETDHGDFNQIKEITFAIGSELKSTIISDRKLGFRHKELSVRIQLCQEAQGDILNDYGVAIQKRIFDLRDALLKSNYGRRLSSVIGHIRNTYDPSDTSEFYFMVWDGRLVSIPKGARKHRFFKHRRKPDLSRVVDAPIICWYGAIDGIEDGLLAVLPPSWIAQLKPPKLK